MLEMENIPGPEARVVLLGTAGELQSLCTHPPGT